MESISKMKRFLENENGGNSGKRLQLPFSGRYSRIIYMRISEYLTKNNEIIFIYTN